MSRTNSKVLVTTACLAALALLDGRIDAQQAGLVRRGPAYDGKVALAPGLIAGTRIPAANFNPVDLPRFGFSFGVIVNDWTKPLALGRILPAKREGGLEGQLRSALDQLDAKLKEAGHVRDSILKLDVYFVGKRFEDGMLPICDVLKDYFHYRLTRTLNPPGLVEFPVRNIMGVGEIEGGALVAIEPTILDPELTSNARLLDTKATVAGGRKTFLAGAITAQQPSFLISGYGDPQAEMKAALRNLNKVLAPIGATPANVRSVTLILTEQAAGQRDQLSRMLAQHLGPKAPEIATKLVAFTCSDGITLAIDVMGEI